ncbi:MAG: chromate transporter [Bdellovibrionales bacterium]|nr:chromate transporter [Bdellovibrionales bacterium]
MRAGKLVEIARSQLKVGTFGFGGPLATMSFMRDELVHHKKLVSDARYLEGLGVVKLLPGPVSTLLAIFLGQEIAGIPGGLVSGLCFIFPSFLALLGISVLHDRLPPGIVEAPLFRSIMEGVQIAVLAVVFYTCWKLFSEAAKRPYAGKARPAIATLFGLSAAALAFLHLPELVILLASGVSGALLLSWLASRSSLRVDPLSLFWVFFTAGVTVFGTGYMVLPHLQRVLVEEHAWLSTQDFLDAVAWGNLTPGPVVIASTYMGHRIAGLGGALAATAGIFAAPFVLMLALSPLLKRVLGRPWVEGAMMGLLPAVAATIAVGLLALGRGVKWGPIAFAMLLLCTVLCFRRWSVVKVFGIAALLGALSWAIPFVG